MRVTPVKRYDAPTYPTRDLVDAQPALLRLVPRRWQNNALVLSALATVCTLLVHSRALAQENAQPAAPAASPAEGVATLIQQKKIRTSEYPPGNVSPVFPYGDGQGSFGCSAVNPPVVLSEAEAREIIIDEGKKAGITFTPDVHSLPDFLPPSFMQRWHNPQLPERLPFKFDGTDTKKNISFEYVSVGDAFSWGEVITGQDTSLFSTSRSSDTRDAAIALRTRLDTLQPEGRYGIFYDPLVPDTYSRSIIIGPFTTSVSYYWHGRLITQASPVPCHLPVVYTSAQFATELGARVRWNVPGKTVQLRTQNTKIQMTEGVPYALVDGKRVPLPAPMFIRNDIPYVPLRFCAERLGCTITWDKPKRSLRLSQPGRHRALTSGITVEKQNIAGKLTYALLAFTNFDRSAGEIINRQESERLLRDQVRGFIYWLRDQGVI